MILNPLDSYLASALYLLLLFIIYKGLAQYIKQTRYGATKSRSLIPLGAVGLILGIIGYIRGYTMTFEAIEAVGDISPELVANSLGQNTSYPVLGLVTLAVTFVFRYLNQQVA